MTYLLLFSYIYIYTFLVRTRGKKFISFFISFLPVAVLLVMIFSLQEGVGTDYYTYYSLAEGAKGLGWIANKSESLFVMLVELVIKIGRPQLLFAFSSVIQITFLTMIAFEIKKLGYKLHDFFFLFFTLTTSFFSQFNGIRQYIAVYIVVYAFLKLIDGKKILYCSLIILASLFHASSIYLIIFIFLDILFKKKIPIKGVFIIFIALFILSITNISKYINLILSFTKYQSYMDSVYTDRINLLNIVTKLPRLVSVLISSYLLYNRDLTRKEIQLINLGYLSTLVLILSFSSTLIWRFYQYLAILIIFPVLMLFNERKYRNIKVVISVFLFAMLIAKIIVIPKGEYLYRSILFK